MDNIYIEALLKRKEEIREREREKKEGKSG